jgi:hypothetical protein
VATTDPASLPGHSTSYLLTNLPRPASSRAQQADLTDIVRLHGPGNWVEQGDKQVKGERGWADFQVRSDRAIRRHWTLVCWAFSFCWQAVLAEQPAAPESQVTAPAAAPGATAAGHRRRTSRAGGTGLAGPLERAGARLAVVVASTAARQLQELLDGLAAGRPLHLYLPQ